MIDFTVAYNRYRFLGEEFLTWLWHLIETDPNFFSSVDPDCSALQVGNRMVLENRKNKSVEKITIKGDDAGLEEGKLALQKGALVAELALVYNTGEHLWQFCIKGESLNISSLRTPGPAFPLTPEDMEQFLLDKTQQIFKILNFIEIIYKYFIKSRISNNWLSKTLPSMKKWVFSDSQS
jgi:hypothetical protein